MTRKTCQLFLLSIFGVLWIALAMSPADRADWLLENALLVAGLVALIATRNVFPLSRLSHTAIFLFLCLHTVGAHYNCAEVS